MPNGSAKSVLGVVGAAKRLLVPFKAIGDSWWMRLSLLEDSRVDGGYG